MERIHFLSCQTINNKVVVLYHNKESKTYCITEMSRKSYNDWKISSFQCKPSTDIYNKEQIAISKGYTKVDSKEMFSYLGKQIHEVCLSSKHTTGHYRFD